MLAVTLDVFVCLHMHLFECLSVFLMVGVNMCVNLSVCVSLYSLCIDSYESISVCACVCICLSLNLYLWASMSAVVCISDCVHM